MLFIILASRGLLALVFLVAALGKFADLPGSRQAVRGFGIVGPIADVVGTTLPAAELSVSAALLFAETAWWGAVGAALLLTCFAVVIGANLLRGKTPDCHCFGQLHSAPAGPKTLARNVILAAFAGVVIVRGPHSLTPGVGEFAKALSSVQLAWVTATSLVLCACVASTWFMLQLYKQNGRLLQRIDALEQRVTGETNHLLSDAVPASSFVGLHPGSLAPEFELTDLAGKRRSLSSLLTESKPLMLIFIDPECGPCQAMLPAIANWYAEFGEIMKPVIISRGTVPKNLEKFDGQDLPEVLLQQDREVAAAYQSYGTPGAIWIDSDGLIASYVAQGSIEIEKLFVEQCKRAIPELPPAHHVGDVAPEFVLPTLAGKPAKLADFLGASLVVLFWNPSCGFCLRMLEELKAWERRASRSGPKLLVISAGSSEANRQMGFKSKILLDDDFRVGRAFGVSGTPSAIRLDERGVVSTPVAAGEDAVRSLLEF